MKTFSLKNNTAIVCGALLLTASLAKADSDLNFNQSRVSLGECGGTATLIHGADGKPELRLNGVEHCSNVTIQMKLERKESGEHALVLPMGMDTEATFQVTSNSGKTSNQLRVNTKEEYAPALPEVRVGQNFSLNNCLGSVRLVSSNYGKLNLVFHDVKNCPKFKIISNNGRSLDYQKKLQDQGTTWGGIFSLPEHMVDFGRNHMVVSAEGYMGTHDQFVLIFDGVNL